MRRDRPLRAIRTIVNEALAVLGARVCRALFADWAAVDPAGEDAAGDAVAGVLFGPLRAASGGAVRIRPPVPLVRRIGVDDAAWDHSVFSKNRDRLLEGDIAAKFLAAVLAQPRVEKLLSSDHFLVDGTLIEALASMKSASGRNARTTPTPRLPIPMPGSTARAKARSQNCASSGTG